MKTTHTLTLAGLVMAAISFAAPVAAQPEIDLTRQQQAIDALSFMVGEWHGEARVQHGPEPEVGQMVEKIHSHLDGTLLMLEGLGTSTAEDGAVTTTHQALGLIWFDEEEDRYRMKAFVPGRVTDADIEVSDDGLVWGFDTPGGRVRYTATFTDDTWTEHGAFSPDGETWMPFFEMTLQKVMGDEGAGGDEGDG